MKHILNNLDADGINVRINGVEDYERLAESVKQHTTRHNTKLWNEDSFEKRGGKYVNVCKCHTGEIDLHLGPDPDAITTMHIDELLNNHLPDTFHIPTDELTVEQKKHILQILEDHTDILWSGVEKPTDFVRNIQEWDHLSVNYFGGGELTYSKNVYNKDGARIMYYELCEVFGDIPNHRKAHLYRGGSAYNNMRTNRILEELYEGSSSATPRGGCSKKDYPLMCYDTIKKAFTIEDKHPVKPAITKMRDNQPLMSKAINTFKKLTRSKETKAEIKAGLRHEDGKLNYQEVCPFVVEYLYKTDEKFREHIQEAADIINENKE